MSHHHSHEHRHHHHHHGEEEYNGHHHHRHHEGHEERHEGQRYRGRHHHGEREGGGPRVETHLHGSAGDIAGYLEQLASALRGGGVQIRTDHRAVGLRLDDEVVLDLRAASGDEQMSQIVLAISWETPPVAPPTPELHISTLPPTAQTGVGASQAPHEHEGGQGESQGESQGETQG